MSNAVRFLEGAVERQIKVAAHGMELLSLIKRQYPYLLDQPVLSAYTSGYSDRLVLSLGEKDPAPVLSMLMDATGQSLLRKTVTSSHSVAEFKLNGITVQVKRARERECRKARVTQVIEVCGDADEQYYENVEYIDQEEAG